jgi:uncharacterized protein (UPF0335 family)
MGAYDYMMNAIQSGQIRELVERVEKLEEQNAILYEWVQYFKQQLETKNDQS